MQRIRKGDTVKILSGKDRGKTGKVLRVDEGGERILVEGLNMKKKHVRPKRQDKKGEIILLPTPLNSSKAMPICQSCKKPVRAGYKINNSGQKTRVCRKCGEGF